jgi:hypothetical protein
MLNRKLSSTMVSTLKASKTPLREANEYMVDIGYQRIP